VKRWVFVPLLAAAAALADVNGIVLRVGDRIVTLYDYRQRYAERLQLIQRRETDSQRQAELLASAGRTTFCELFQEMVVLARADQQRLEVSDEQVGEAVAQSKENLGLETDEQFREALQASGLTEEVLREQLRKSLLVQQVMGNQLRDRVQLDEEDLRRYYQSHLEDFRVPRRLHLREFVVLETGTASAKANQLLAVTLAARAREVGLEAAAGQESSGEVSEVIDLGWVEGGDLDPSLETAVWELPAGAVSEPVAARGGLHVVEVAEVEEAHLLSFAEVRDRIEERERQRLIGEEMGTFMAELAETSYVVEQPPPEAVGYRETCLTGEAAEEPTLEAPEG
jgi:parvulin-like peptidyl-prolyl isomerase